MAAPDNDSKRAKIERARAAGAYIDPAIEQKWLSGEATFPKFMDEPENVKAVRQPPPGFTEFEVIPTPPEAKAAQAKAVAEAKAKGVDIDREANSPATEDEPSGDDEEGDRRLMAAPSCTLRASYPYKAAGMAQGDNSHECYQIINRHELYGKLLKWYCYADGSCKWVQMETRFAAKSAPNAQVKIATHPRYDCVKNTVWRYWRHRAEAYVQDRFGTWFGPSVLDHQDTLQCG